MFKVEQLLSDKWVRMDTGVGLYALLSVRIGWSVSLVSFMLITDVYLFMSANFVT